VATNVSSLPLFRTYPCTPSKRLIVGLASRFHIISKRLGHGYDRMFSKRSASKLQGAPAQFAACRFSFFLFCRSLGFDNVSTGRNLTLRKPENVEAAKLLSYNGGYSRVTLESRHTNVASPHALNVRRHRKTRIYQVTIIGVFKHVTLLVRDGKQRYGFGQDKLKFPQHRI
jgi:hypothetical protein